MRGNEQTGIVPNCPVCYGSHTTVHKFLSRSVPGLLLLHSSMLIIKQGKLLCLI